MKLRPLLVAGIAAATVSLTACGGAQDVASGDETAMSTGTTATLTRDNFVEQVAQAQRQARTAHLDMQVETGGQQVAATGEVRLARTGADSAMAMTATLPGAGDVEIRAVDGVLYVNLGPLTENKFARIDLSDSDNPLGKSFEGLVGQLDPAESLQAIDGAITGFDKSGDERRIDGVATQPYEVTVDTAKAGESFGAGSDASGVPSSELPSEVTATFWVGEDNLPRRIQTEVAGATVRVDLSEWGEDVDVDAPAADQVTETDPFNGTLPSATPTS